MEKNIAIIQKDAQYLCKAPYRPAIRYPEYPFDEISDENNIYEMVRECFNYLKLDKEKSGDKEWNPLQEFINRGDSVLIKPNLVMDYNGIKSNGVECLYTHPAVVATITDYVIIALKGEGRIIIGDAPMQECNFDKLIHQSGYEDLLEYYRQKLRNTKISIELVDFRGLISINERGINHAYETGELGHLVKLNEDSEFYGMNSKKIRNLRITNYDPIYLRKHHNDTTHEYCISKYLLNANCVINIPKPKTHRKAGVTISMKNMVGINCRKEFLPHHTNGSLAEGGDEYENKSTIKNMINKLLDYRNQQMQTKHRYKYSWLITKGIGFLHKVSNKVCKDDYFEGSWYKNDTICRTIVDLNKILFYADQNGEMQTSKQRKYLVLSDMVVSGEKEGPIKPSPKNVGIIAMGDDPVCFDEVILTLMGAKIECISTVLYGRNTSTEKFSLTEKGSEGVIVSNNPKWNGKRYNELDIEDTLRYYPPYGWEKAFY